MGKYRVKPRETEAVQFDGSNWVEMINFCGTRTVDGHEMLLFNPVGTYLMSFMLTAPKPHIKAELYMKDKEGHAYVAVGEWVVKRGEGDFWLCDDKTFHAFYEEVSDGDVSSSS